MIGVLDLQGDVVEHLDHLDRLDIPFRRVKTPADTEGIRGLIIPGGESTCLSRLLKLSGLGEVIRSKHQAGLKLWGTCAGAILLARHITGEHPHLPVIDITIERNGFGSQLDSFTTKAVIPSVAPYPMNLVFIRAPKIRQVGAGVKVLLSFPDYIAAAEDASTIVTVFHPELAPTSDFHRYFAQKCGIDVSPERVDPSSWSPTSWTRFARVA